MSEFRETNRPSYEESAQEQQEKLTFGQKVSDWVAKFGGSWPFVITFVLVLLAWMFFNTFSYFKLYQFDKPPFVLLNLVLSTIAAIQAPIIMMSQNRQEAKDRLRSQYDYQVNLKAELEIELLHQKMDLMRELEIKKLTELVEELIKQNKKDI